MQRSPERARLKSSGYVALLKCAPTKSLSPRFDISVRTTSDDSTARGSLDVSPGGCRYSSARARQPPIVEACDSTDGRRQGVDLFHGSSRVIRTALTDGGVAPRGAGPGPAHLSRSSVKPVNLRRETAASGRVERRYGLPRNLASMRPSQWIRQDRRHSLPPDTGCWRLGAAAAASAPSPTGAGGTSRTLAGFNETQFRTRYGRDDRDVRRSMPQDNE